MKGALKFPLYSRQDRLTILTTLTLCLSQLLVSIQFEKQPQFPARCLPSSISPTTTTTIPRRDLEFLRLFTLRLSHRFSYATLMDLYERFTFLTLALLREIRNRGR